MAKKKDFFRFGLGAALAFVLCAAIWTAATGACAFAKIALADEKGDTPAETASSGDYYASADSVKTEGESDVYAQVVAFLKEKARPIAIISVIAVATASILIITFRVGRRKK